MPGRRLPGDGGGVDPYSAPHLAALAVLVAGLPVAVLLGRRERRAGDDRLSRAFAVAIPMVFVPTQVVELAARWDLQVSMPLHLCDLAWVAAALALWTQDRRVVTLTYLWSPLTLQAVLTPSLGEDFPDLRFLAYWALHLLILWAAAFLVGGLGLTPDWRGFRFAVAVTAAWVATAAAFNVAFGTNYGYLMRKPGSGSVLDLLGPWPGYLLVEAVVVLAAWVLMTAALAGWRHEHPDRRRHRFQRPRGVRRVPGAGRPRRLGAGRRAA